MNIVAISIKIADFDIGIENLSEIIDLKPTESFLKGQTYSVKTCDGFVQKLYPNSFWEYRVSLKVNEWSQVLIDKFIEETIVPRKAAFRQLAEKFYLELYICIDLHEDGNPSFHFGKDKMQLLGEMGIELDVELYMH